MTLLALSAIYKSPDWSKAMPRGAESFAAVAWPPSPQYPARLGSHPHHTSPPHWKVRRVVAGKRVDGAARQIDHANEVVVVSAKIQIVAALIEGERMRAIEEGGCCRATVTATAAAPVPATSLT